VGRLNREYNNINNGGANSISLEVNLKCDFN